MGRRSGGAIERSSQKPLTLSLSIVVPGSAYTSALRVRASSLASVASADSPKHMVGPMANFSEVPRFCAYL